MKVFYLDNSGFAMISEDVLLIFDYWRFPKESEAATFESGFVDVSKLSDFARVYIFVSHKHGDHFNKKIYELAQYNAHTKYIVETDVPLPEDFDGVKLAVGQQYADDFLKVTAWPSTDIGASFQVDFAGRTIFHAGDLNYWHWQEESTKEEVQEAYEAYISALAQMAGHLPSVDIAFFPVDPRMVSDIEVGAMMFMEQFKPKTLIAMHFGQAFEAMQTAVEKIKVMGNVLAPQSRGDILIDE